MKKRKTRGKFLSVLTVFAMVVTTLCDFQENNQIVKAATDYGLSNPIINEQPIVMDEKNAVSHGLLNPGMENGVAAWNTIYFGNYWQNDTNGDGKVDQNDEKQPIRWRVLSVNGDDAFLLADQNLDVQPYNTTRKTVTWEKCSLRKWLNQDFLNAAFSEQEKKIIASTKVKNDDNPAYGQDGGKDTKDRVYLLSIEEASNPSYGFDSVFDVFSKTRANSNTGYVMGKCKDSLSCWLRSPGESGKYASIFESYKGNYVNYSKNGVRPVIHISLASSLWTKGETKWSESVTTWDTVYFGNYWQNDTNGDGKVDQNDEKQPIRWRVLSVNGDDAFLLADQPIDGKPYNIEDKDTTWESCSLRNWLSHEFLANAFTDVQQQAILTTDVKNDDNPLNNTKGGNNTKDQIYLLSIAEVTNALYGFDTDFRDLSRTRATLCTKYAEDKASSSERWWLRSPGAISSYASFIDYDGTLCDAGSKVTNVDVDISVRPVLHLSLSSGLWIKGEPIRSSQHSNKKSATQISKPNIVKVTAPAKAKIISAKNRKGKKVALKIKKIKGVMGYQIKYATNKKFKKAKIKNITKTSYTIKKLKKKKTYYIKVRAYKANGKNNVYGKWSAMKKVKIKK